MQAWLTSWLMAANCDNLSPGLFLKVGRLELGLGNFAIFTILTDLKTNPRRFYISFTLISNQITPLYSPSPPAFIIIPPLPDIRQFAPPYQDLHITFLPHSFPSPLPLPINYLLSTQCTPKKHPHQKHRLSIHLHNGCLTRWVPSAVWFLLKTHLIILLLTFYYRLKGQIKDKTLYRINCIQKHNTLHTKPSKWLTKAQ